jgi:phospholipase C
MRTATGARWASALALLALLALLVPVLGPTGAAAADSASPATPRTPLRHVVVMLQQGHTFDNYFGTRQGVDGLPRQVCLPSPEHRHRCVSPYPLHGSPHVAFLDTAAAQRRAVDGGRMDGFVRVQDVHGQDARAAMGYYPARTLPVLSRLADTGVLFDHWFSGVLGSPVANDLFEVAARAPAGAVSVPRRGWQGTPLVFDRLQAAGVPWRVYVEGYRRDVTYRTAGPGELRGGQVARVPVLATARFLGAGDLAEHVAPLPQYYDDLARGRLPAVSFVVTTRLSERPPHDPVHDQSAVRAVANGLIASSAWPHSAFLLTYTSPGGWYDHVPPPRLGGAQVGLRVPTVLVSPFVHPGTVVHETFDAASVLRLIEQNWGLSPLTSRDRTAPSLLPVFSFRHARPRPALVDVTSSRPPLAQPDTGVLYAGYLVALAAGLGCIVLVARRGGWSARRS